MVPRKFVCLMYHELERPGRPLCQMEPGYLRYVVAEAKFRDQMRWLHSDGWRGMSIGTALASREPRGIALTFDDGSETDLTLAAAILKETGNNATFYITAGFLGKPGYLSPAQLRELSGLGFEIGCHSMTHPYLTDLDDAALHTEIVDARQRIEQIIGNSVEHFSCPGGRYDHRAIEIARDAGYKSVANSRVAANSLSADPFSLNRIAILRHTDDPAFRAICRGEGLWNRRLRDSLQHSARAAMGNTLYESVRTLLLR